MYGSHRCGEKNPMYGKHHTTETRNKMSEKMTGKPLSDEHKRKISEARKGKHWKLVNGKRVWY